MSPRISFHGASGSVTGSCYLIDTGQSRILVDCGMFQGSKSERELNYREFPFDPSTLRGVVLTHAHIDHSGLLPKLVKHGFTGPIHATRATVDLCSVMLPDSGHIQEMEVEQLNRRNRRRGIDPVKPIYTAEDAQAMMPQFRPCAYRAWTSVASDIRIRFWNAGHLLGSASVEMEIGQGASQDDAAQKPLRILFSGDIGPDHKALEPDPEAPEGFDYLLCESTYGDTDRNEVSPDLRREMLRNEVLQAVQKGGAMLIPSFAVERTQELMVDLVGLMNDKLIPSVPVFIDSPLATKASVIFSNHARELEMGEVLREAMHSSWVRFTESPDQSRAISRIRDPHIIIAASGMADAGRIRHHLKEWLWRSQATVLFVGFQAQGTLGRILLDGAAKVRIQGDEIRVRAAIRSLGVYSGHADGPELASWVRKRLPIAHNVFLVHGEPPAFEGLRGRLADIVAPQAVIVPDLDAGYELTDAGAVLQSKRKAPRIDREKVARLDWHNDLSRLFLDINDAVADAADEKSRAVLLRRLRHALEDEMVP